MTDDLIPDGQQINDNEANRIYLETLHVIADEIIGDSEHLKVFVKDGDIARFRIIDPDEILTDEQVDAIKKACNHLTERLAEAGYDVSANRCTVHTDDDASREDAASDLVESINEKVDEMSCDARMLARAVGILAATDRIDVDRALDKVRAEPYVSSIIEILCSSGGIASNVISAGRAVFVESEILSILARGEDDIETYYRTSFTKGLAAMARAHMEEDERKEKESRRKRERKPIKDFVPEGSPDHTDESPAALEQAWHLIHDEGLDEYTDIARISHETSVPERVVKTMIDKQRSGE